MTPQVKEGTFGGVGGQDEDILKDGVSGFIRGLGVAQEVGYHGKELLKEAPLLDDPGILFYRIN